ncbi:MAG: sensor histidine kinase KdpD [Deltaproteobacteria bacterium]|nr:sensor histidine kinase KdpD [Deltaproteobacteria bacterium]
MEERRPDPDVLLKQAQREEERKREGTLKIFFGAAPGVGKTFAMLEAAQAKRAEGLDVVVGYVETHGRPDTEALLEGLERLPRRSVDYRGKQLPEFDLDAALARKPTLILVDELAHTNVPVSRHKKRWQDVTELLEAGINVYTTVNVQHLESINDVVHRITGVVVRETLPDSILDRADEIELIDLPPDDLLQRLREGKVYVPELAASAVENFFRKGNLIALRELALRRTAERVDEQMQLYRRDQGIRSIWPAADRILVCVGYNPRSIRLIHAARRLAAGLRTEWIAVHVEAPSRVRPSESDKKRLADHMRLAESLGAESATLTGGTISEEILTYARSRNVNKIIVGKPTHARWKDKLFGSPLDELVRGSGDIDVYVTSGDVEEPHRHPETKTSRRSWRKREWLWSVLIVLSCTAVAALMSPYVDRVDLAMVYLLGVVITASKTSTWPSLFAALLGVAAFDVFFVPPYYTFAVNDVKYFFTFAAMFIVSVVISRLTLRVRRQAEASRMRERRTAYLYNLSRDLAREREVERLSEIAVKHMGEVFDSEVAVLIADEQKRLTPTAISPGLVAPGQQELSVAQWVLEHHQPAGFGTDTLPGAKALYLPLIASAGTVGVVGISPKKPQDAFDPEQFHYLEAYANQTAMAMERAFLVEEAHGALLKAERESLRNTLLSSISHDLRTPLTAITGAVSTLLQNDVAIEQSGRLELLHTIHEEAERLNRIIKNILDMSRLESGAITVNKEWQSLEEIVGVVLNRLGDRLNDHPLTMRLPRTLPLIAFDGLLIEQVFMNLFENAIKYTPKGTPLELSASEAFFIVTVELADRGPGIPPGEEEHIFEKFVRGRASGGGVGLGLTICRTIINAHGGKVWAENRPGGGAVFRFTLPATGLPPMPKREEVLEVQ